MQREREAKEVVLRQIEIDKAVRRERAEEMRLRRERAEDARLRREQVVGEGGFEGGTGWDGRRVGEVERRGEEEEVEGMDEKEDEERGD